MSIQSRTQYGPVSRPPRCVRPDVLRVEGIVELHLDAGHPVAQPGELLGGGERRVGERGVVLVHADLDLAGHLESPHLGHEAHRGHGALRARSP